MFFYKYWKRLLVEILLIKKFKKLLSILHHLRITHYKLRISFFKKIQPAHQPVAIGSLLYFIPSYAKDKALYPLKP